MQDQSFQSNKERNHSKFVHIDIYLFFWQYNVSHNAEENKMTPYGHGLPNFAALPTKLSRYCIYSLFFHTHHKQQHIWEHTISQNQ